MSKTHSNAAVRLLRNAVDLHINGVLLLDKPEGPSSNQVLQRVKRLFEARKAGHTGTLDPIASGLLPIAFGEATKFSGFLLSSTKSYEATFALGVSTTTGDITGEIVRTSSLRPAEDQMRMVIQSFVGPQLQTPPMHSAIKRDGVPLYKLARRGAIVDRPARAIEISELHVIRHSADEIDVRVRCSKGTYIRVLGEDIGRALGCGATLKRLRRIEVAAFLISNAHTLDALERLAPSQRCTTLLPLDAGLEHLPALVCEHGRLLAFRMGQSVPHAASILESIPVARIYDSETNEFLGLGRLSDARLHPVRLIVPDATKMS